MVKILMSTTAPGRKWLITLIVIAAIGVSAGIMVGIYFIHPKNWHVVFWGFFSALWALAAMLLHIFYMKGRLRNHTDRLKTLTFVSAFGQLLGFSALVVYLVLGIVFHDNLKDLGRSYYVAAVWGFMTWKWAFNLFWFGRKYRYLLLEEALIPVGGEDFLYSEAAGQVAVTNTSDVSFT